MMKMDKSGQATKTRRMGGQGQATKRMDKSGPAITTRRMEELRRPTTRMVRMGGDDKENGRAEASNDKDGQGRQQQQGVWMITVR